MIKFRGKRVNNGEWVYGYLFEHVWAKGHCSYIIKDQFVPAVSIPTNRFIEVIPETVGQLVRTTEGGVNIWEGDKAKIPFILVDCQSSHEGYIDCEFREVYYKSGFVYFDDKSSQFRLKWDKPVSYEFGQQVNSTDISSKGMKELSSHLKGIGEDLRLNGDNAEFDVSDEIAKELIDKKWNYRADIIITGTIHD